MYKKNFNERPFKERKKAEQLKTGNDKKEKRPKRNFDLPSFIDSDGNVITYAIGVRVPQAESGKPEEKKALLELAIRYFKRKVKDSGILVEYKSRKEYIKKSAKRRRQKLEAIRREERGFTITE